MYVCMCVCGKRECVSRKTKGKKASGIEEESDFAREGRGEVESAGEEDRTDCEMRVCACVPVSVCV